MSEVHNTRVTYIDDDHIFVDNRQFVSLKRFAEARREIDEEMKLLIDQHNELIKENTALKALLKTNL